MPRLLLVHSSIHFIQQSIVKVTRAQFSLVRTGRLSPNRRNAISCKRCVEADTMRIKYWNKTLVIVYNVYRIYGTLPLVILLYVLDRGASKLKLLFYGWSLSSEMSSYCFNVNNKCFKYYSCVSLVKFFLQQNVIYLNWESAIMHPHQLALPLCRWPTRYIEIKETYRKNFVAIIGPEKQIVGFSESCLPLRFTNGLWITIPLLGRQDLIGVECWLFI